MRDVFNSLMIVHVVLMALKDSLLARTLYSRRIKFTIIRENYIYTNISEITVSYLHTHDEFLLSDVQEI